MLQSGWTVLCLMLATLGIDQGPPPEPPREATLEEFFPLAVGQVWKYEGQEHGERSAAAGSAPRRSIVKRVVGKRTIALGSSEEVEAFEIEVETQELRSDSAPPDEPPPSSQKRKTEFAVDRGDRVEIYAAGRDETGRARYERTHQWPRTRPQGEEFEEVLWLGRGGRKTWKVTDVDVDLPDGKGKGIKLRWMTEGTSEEGYEAVLAPGVGIVSYRCAVYPCRGPYMDWRETLVAFER